MTKKLFFFVILVLASIPAFAQVDTAWVRTYNGTDYPIAIAVDDSGNVYMTAGAPIIGGGFDGYVTIKYDPNGNELWVRRYNGPGNGGNEARAMAIDGSGNVYVTGESYGGSGTYMDYATIKYYSNGDIAWVRRYNGPGGNYWYLDNATAIAVDGYGNVYVTGESMDSVTGDDYATIKYDPSGDELWVRRYAGTNVSTGDLAYAIAVDGSGNVYVTGTSGDTTSWWDYATIKYDPNGNQLWVRRYNGPGNGDDYAYAIAVDGYGNVYVTGESYGSGTEGDYATIKYYPNGNTAWVRRYNGPGDSTDCAFAIAVDDSGNVYVNGCSHGSGPLNDYATIKYDPNGNQLWVRRYNGPENSNDWSRVVAVDSSNNVYVTGGSSNSDTSYDYATIKYYPNGDTGWVSRYNGWGAYAIAVDKSNNVYVTGWPVTIKYIPSTWTIMVYMDGDNNLSQSAFKDVNEMELGTDSMSAVTCIVLYDSIQTGGGDSRIYRIKQDTDASTINSEIINDGGAVIPPSHEVNMGDPNTLEAFAKWGIEHYPARHYALIMWDHGHGWQKMDPDKYEKGYGLCIDETNNHDRLYIDEIKNALASITHETGIVFDVIGFDACLMGMLENAYQIRNFGKVMVASEESIPGDGWDYDSTLLALSHSACWDAESLGTRIVKDYIRSYTDGLGDPPDDDTVTLAAIDLSKIEALGTSVDNFGKSLYTEWAMIRDERGVVEHYKIDPNSSIKENVDLFHLASLIRASATDPNIINSAQDVMNATDAAVIFNGRGPAHPNSHGLAIYFPDSVWKYNSMYEDKPDLSHSTFWDDFLRRYNTYSPGEGPTPSVITVPNYALIGEPFDITWTGSFDADGVQCYALVELKNVNVLFLDDAENGDINWDLNGFSIRTTLANSPTHSFYSNPPNQYNDNVTNTMTLKNPVAIPADSTVLSFWCKWEIEKDADFLYIEVATSREGPWIELDALTGVQGSAYYKTYNLKPYAGTSIYIRFRYVTDYMLVMEGFYVDDIKVESIGSATALSDNLSSPTYTVPGRPEGRYYYQVIAKDELGNWGHWSNRDYINVGSYFPGDANGDTVINVSDVVYLINYLFISGPAPDPIQAGDVNCDGFVNVTDVVYLINYLFISGPPPCK